MKKRLSFALFALSLVLACTGVRGQEKPKAAEPASGAPASKATAVKVRVLITEYEGERKIKSLPYDFMISVGGPNPEWTKLKMGSRVPVATGAGASAGAQFQYIDVGTHIDCRAARTEDRKFAMEINIERSWVDGETPVPLDAGTSQPAASFPEPVIRQFQSQLKLLLEEGQPQESSVATDPLSGKVLKVEVTILPRK